MQELHVVSWESLQVQVCCLRAVAVSCAVDLLSPLLHPFVPMQNVLSVKHSHLGNPSSFGFPAGIFDMPPPGMFAAWYWP